MAELAGPLSHALHATGYGMRGGRIVGEQVERVGAAGAHVLDKVGDGAEVVLKTRGMAIGQVVNFGSATMQVSAKASTTVIASGRELTGSIEATLHRAESQARSGGMSALSWITDKVGWTACPSVWPRKPSAPATTANIGRKAPPATRSPMQTASGRWATAAPPPLVTMVSGLRASCRTGSPPLAPTWTAVTIWLRPT